MKEMVLYYNPVPAPYVAKLKGVLVRMGVRIKNISPKQVNQKVGYLAGIPGFTETATDSGQDRAEIDKLLEAEKISTEIQLPKTEKTSKETESQETGETLASENVSVEEEMLVMKNFTSRRIDELLINLRKAGVPKIALKAVLTEQNSQWTFYHLYEELKSEHRKMLTQSEAPMYEAAEERSTQ